MSYILNIGLARKGNSNIGVGTVLREIVSHGFYIQQHAIHHSDTEITVVAKVTRQYGYTPVVVALRRMADFLGQDCVAVWDIEREHGALVGPNAAAWGEFNPEFFLQLDGSRLAAAEVVVA